MLPPNNSPQFIRWLFNNRCVGLDEPCYKIARDVAHIEGRAINDEWTNKVLLCAECHAEWHRRGVSDKDIARLKERRIEYLEAIGREQYI